MKRNGDPSGHQEASRANLERQEWIQTAIAEHEGPLMRYARHFLDQERARDVVQDTFIRLLQCDPAEVSGHLRPWLFKVCRNRAIDVCRKESRMSLSDSSTLDQNANSGKTPAALVEQQDSSAHLQSLVGELSERHQEILRLKFQSGLSYKEIAQVMEITVSNVGFILHTAIQKVRKKAVAGFGHDSQA